MSLDVYLWKEKYVCYGKPSLEGLKREDEMVFCQNITHNLNEMAMAVSDDFYKALWRPEEINCKYAKDIVLILSKGYFELLGNEEVYKKYDSPNGWGLYKNFLPWVKEYLDACKEHPDSEIEVSR